METADKGDFVELEFTGKINGQIFDSNKSEDLKHLNSKASPQEMFVIVGQGMIVKGLDDAVIGKEIGKQYDIHLMPKDAFGTRNASLVRTIPLKVFTDKQVYPKAGMSFALDNSLVQIRAVSGARVIADFNNPLAGKEVDYSFTLKKKITSLEEKSRIFFKLFLGQNLEIDVQNKVIVKAEKNFEPIINLLAKKFQELIGKELEFSEKSSENKPSPQVEDSTQQSL